MREMREGQKMGRWNMERTNTAHCSQGKPAGSFSSSLELFRSNCANPFAHVVIASFNPNHPDEALEIKQ